MTRPLVTSTVLLIILHALLCSGCATTPDDSLSSQTYEAWPGELIDDDPQTREVTVIIALSSIVPGGIIGHTGIAVDQQYWDFGPKRVEQFQQLKAIRSTAGPWWDDPDQRWQANRTLAEVADDMPDKLHPVGSLVAVFRVELTDEQADAIIAFWNDTYQRMADKHDRYHLAGRQCSNMVGWSLASALGDLPGGDRKLPDELRMMTPSRLYEILRNQLRHTAGPRAGERADLTLWQLGPDGLQPYDRYAQWDRAGLPQLPRLRLAIERFKHMPGQLLD